MKPPLDWSGPSIQIDLAIKRLDAALINDNDLAAAKRECKVILDNLSKVYFWILHQEEMSRGR
jgi:hypothetical protein